MRPAEWTRGWGPAAAEETGSGLSQLQAGGSLGIWASGLGEARCLVGPWAGQRRWARRTEMTPGVGLEEAWTGEGHPQNGSGQAAGSQVGQARPCRHCPGGTARGGSAREEARSFLSMSTQVAPAQERPPRDRHAPPTRPGRRAAQHRPAEHVTFGVDHGAAVLVVAEHRPQGPWGLSWSAGRPGHSRRHDLSGQGEALGQTGGAGAPEPSVMGPCPQLETRSWEEAQVGPGVGLLHPCTLLGLGPPLPGPAARRRGAAQWTGKRFTPESRGLPLDTGL